MQARLRELLAQPLQWQPDVWLALAVGLAFVALHSIGLGNPGGEYDEGVYVSSLRWLAHGQPLYSSVYHAQPPLFLFLLLPWYLLFGQTLAAARMGVLLYALAGMSVCWWTVRMIAGLRAALIAVAILAFDPFFFVAARTVQAEGPAITFALMALALAFVTASYEDELATWWRIPRGLWWAGAAGLLFGISFLTKLFTIPVLIPIFFVLLPSAARDPIVDAIWQRRRLDRSQVQMLWQSARPLLLAFISGIGSALLVALILMMRDLASAYQQVIGLHLLASGSRLSSTPATLSLFARDTLLLVAAGFAAWQGWREHVGGVVVFASWWVVSLLLLLIQKPLFPHHLVLLVPPLIFLAALNAVLVQGNLTYLRIAGGVLAAVMAFDVWAVGPVIQANAQTPDLVTAVAIYDIARFIPPDREIITDEQMLAVLANRDVPPQLVDTSLVRIATGSLTTAQIERLAQSPQVAGMQFWSNRFATLPGLQDWVNSHLVKVADYGGGRTLYLWQNRQPVPTG